MITFVSDFLYRKMLNCGELLPVSTLFFFVADFETQHEVKLNDIQARSAIARAVGKFVTEYIGNEYETAGNDDLAARVGSILDEQKRILGQLSQE